MLLDGFTPYDSIDAETYIRHRWWAGLTFGDMLDRAADVYPEKEAIVDDRGRYTYAQIREKTDRLAMGLYGLGIRPLDRVLVQLPNWHEFVVAYFALQKIGAIPVILIARYRQYEIGHLARLSGATAWIVAQRFGKTDYAPIIEDVLKNHPQITRTLLCRREQRDNFPDLNDVMEQTVLDERSRQLLDDLRPDPMQVAHMGPTGGTTGLPKLAPHTHNNFLCKVEYSARASEFNQTTACLIVLPAAHDLPFANGICATLFACGRLVLRNRTDPDSICQIIQDETINTVIWVPTLAYRVLNSQRLHDFDLSSLHTIYCGGGASSPELIGAAHEKLKCTYICGYGGTEGMLVTTRPHDNLTTCCRTIGKPTCPYDHYKVIDDAGHDLPPCRIGNLVVKGPSIFTGYYNQPQENA
ncbi:MAG: AMP-binding protein, partial [Desulfatirhabdiaceae bacterium]